MGHASSKPGIVSIRCRSVKGREYFETRVWLFDVADIRSVVRLLSYKTVHKLSFYVWMKRRLLLKGKKMR